MNPLAILQAVFKPAAELIDSLHTSKEEKLSLQAKMYEVQANLALQLLEYEKKLMSAQADIIQAEAKGESWIQRSWRPITMLTFLVLTVFDAFGWLPFRLAEQAWALLQVGLGGYVVGRSAEKIAPALADALKKKAP